MSWLRDVQSANRRTKNETLGILRRHEKQQQEIPLSAILTGFVMLGALWVFLQLVSCVQPSLLH